MEPRKYTKQHKKSTKYRYAFLIILLLTSFAHGQKSESAELKRTRGLEDQRIEAILKKDTAALKMLMADDMTYGHSNGVTESKEVFIESMRTGARIYTAFDRRDVNIRLYKNTALITGIANLKAMVSGNPVNVGDVRFLAVWIKQKGTWKFAAWQSTKLPQ